ncbi:unnamed protein product [Rhodiola kirilowii]
MGMIGENWWRSSLKQNGVVGARQTSSTRTVGILSLRWLGTVDLLVVKQIEGYKLQKEKSVAEEEEEKNSLKVVPELIEQVK